MMPAAPPRLLRRCAPCLLYPFLAAITLVYLLHELNASPQAPGRHYPLYLTGMVGLLMAIEGVWPLDRRWRMTATLFWRRDLPYLLLGAATLALGQQAAAAFVAAHGPTRGRLLAGLPLLPAALTVLLLGDFLWYWAHRASHELPGCAGRLLWRIHAAHHLPRQVYVLMHPVAHPLNTLLVRLILVLPGHLLGLSPAATFVVSVLVAFQGLVSHFNADCRAGWLNRLLVGTELHRLHHSADPADRGNYGAVVSLWDQLFGSYRAPRRLPAQLGVEDEGRRLPASTDVAGTLLLPFRPRGF